MQINIKATNFELTPEINDYINKKIGGLEKFIEFAGSSAQIWVEVGRTTKHHRTGNIFRAEIQIRLPHWDKGVRAEAENYDLYAAIDEAREEMKRELGKIKDKKISLIRKGARFFKKIINETINKRIN